ncbi:type VII secretion integral membrane protein EccD [Amycolatopsis jiangsuensis]|uniref:Type VII secretion integral membrane protein EccD n=1 Tax=Amycolatopsis jiangsuensis TaxID=1181879 RepID=A0A840IY57_9PSEU|nr:type VII secretion integral membrane protein EccD [Amycolatopsis jiangsuensis]MBB4687596.1 type VII secretion integral membrane protein EccD [Amycolatopsis jiangsuensis]
MSTLTGELCRITVYGPQGRADLAVPMSVPLTSLLPVLLQHTGGREDLGDSWVLQRLGEQPLDAAGTPESLDWKEGEEFHLRPRQDPLPELDFDDIADGMATAVARQPGRWRPELNRGLFLGFAIFCLVVLARVLLYPGSTGLSAIGGGVLALGLLTAAVATGVRSTDRTLLGLLGLGGCGFAFLAGAVAVAGLGPAFDLQGAPLLTGCLTFALAGGLVLGGRAAWSPAIPFVPFGAVVAIGVGGAVTLWLHLGVGFSTVQTAGLVSFVLVGFMVFAPRVGIRFARIRGPQLPRSAGELQYDIEPAPAEQMNRQTGYANGYLTIACLAATVIFTGCYPFLVDGGLWPAILGGLVTAAVLMRSRALLGVWQRVPLAVSGAIGLVLLGLALIQPLPTEWRGACLGGLAAVFFLLLLAMLRPPPRRLLPIWGHLANWLETLSAVAMIPILLQLFGVYSWAAGLTE